MTDSVARLPIQTNLTASIPVDEWISRNGRRKEPIS